MIVLLPHTLALSMQVESERYCPNETGGILVGLSLEDDAIEIAMITGPGPAALHQSSGFRRDGAFSQEQLEDFYALHGGRYDYVGEWHSHPKPVGPSPRDRKSMKWIANNTAYRIPNPLLLICEGSRKGSWRIKCYRWEGKALANLPLSITT